MYEMLTEAGQQLKDDQELNFAQRRHTAAQVTNSRPRTISAITEQKSQYHPKGTLNEKSKVWLESSALSILDLQP